MDSLTDQKGRMAGKVLVFRLDNTVFAIPLEHVLRVVHAVFIMPLPGSPDAIAGIINHRGSILPVFNIRKRFGLPLKELRPDDRFIILETRLRRVVIMADEVIGIEEPNPENLVDKGVIITESALFTGIIKTTDGMILIHDPDRFLSDEETEALTNAIQMLNQTSE